MASPFANLDNENPGTGILFLPQEIEPKNLTLSDSDPSVTPCHQLFLLESTDLQVEFIAS